MDEPQAFRRVLARYSAGVALITTRTLGQDYAMVVNSFFSVSLKPPLAGFCVGVESTTWPAIADVGRCAVSFLDQSQEQLCRDFVAKSPSRFESHMWDCSPGDFLIPRGRVGWLEGKIQSVVQFGDHNLVVMQTLAGHRCRSGSPLIFDEGRFTTVEH